MGFFSGNIITYKKPHVRVQKNYPEMKKKEGEGGQWIILGDYVNLVILIPPNPRKDAHMMHPNSLELHRV